MPDWNVSRYVHIHNITFFLHMVIKFLIFVNKEFKHIRRIFVLNNIVYDRYYYSI